MDIFAGLKIYATKWQVKKPARSLEQSEINQVVSAVVVPSKFGASVEFTMKVGGKAYIPLSNDSTASVGDVVDLTKAKVIILEKDGEKDIKRIVY